MNWWIGLWIIHQLRRHSKEKGGFTKFPNFLTSKRRTEVVEAILMQEIEISSLKENEIAKNFCSSSERTSDLPREKPRAQKVWISDLLREKSCTQKVTALFHTSLRRVEISCVFRYSSYSKFLWKSSSAWKKYLNSQLIFEHELEFFFLKRWRHRYKFHLSPLNRVE